MNFEDIVKLLVGKREIRPYNDKNVKDGNCNYVHIEDAISALFEVKELYENKGERK